MMAMDGAGHSSRRAGAPWRRLSAAFALLLVAACGTGEQPRTPQPRDGRAGLQLSGTVAGAQVAVNDGLPDLVVGDCTVAGGAQEDLCVASRDLRGEAVVLAIRNPAVLAEGETIPVEDHGCRGRRCDDVTDAVVVDVLLGEDLRQRAAGGMLAMTVVEESERYAGRVRLDLPRGVLSGFFDVVPRPD